MFYVDSVAMEQQILSLKAQLRAYKKQIQVHDKIVYSIYFLSTHLMGSSPSNYTNRVGGWVVTGSAD